MQDQKTLKQKEIDKWKPCSTMRQMNSVHPQITLIHKFGVSHCLKTPTPVITIAIGQNSKQILLDKHGNFTTHNHTQAHSLAAWAPFVLVMEPSPSPLFQSMLFRQIRHAMQYILFNQKKKTKRFVDTGTRTSDHWGAHSRLDQLSYPSRLDTTIR